MFTFVRHPRARRYVLRVADDGTVRVTIPRRGSKKGALEFARAQRSWIEREQARLRRERDADRAGHVGEESHARDRTQWERAARELPMRLLALAAEHGLTVRKISVRDQKWRWGSCSRTGCICLNWRLVLMPDRLRDYVLIHELMHLKRMDHSPTFWKLVARACPDYRERRRELRQLRWT